MCGTAEANHAKMAQDVARYKMLVDKDEISKQVYDQAMSSLDAGRATLEAQRAQVVEAQQNVSAAEKTIEQTRARVEQADAVIQSAMTGPAQVRVTESRAKSAEAKVEEELALVHQAELENPGIHHPVMRAVDGVMIRKNVEAGNNISVGQQLVAVVPLEGVWVTANFKETQLKRMKIGQPLTIKVDAYYLEYTGKVLDVQEGEQGGGSPAAAQLQTENFVVVRKIRCGSRSIRGDSSHRCSPGCRFSPSMLITSEGHERG